MSASDIEHRFAFHPADSVQRQSAHGSVRLEVKQLAHFMDAQLPEGREKSLAITKLEEAMFWANAAIARNA
jgi:hypothetical protein